MFVKVTSKIAQIYEILSLLFTAYRKKIHIYILLIDKKI